MNLRHFIIITLMLCLWVSISCAQNFDAHPAESFTVDKIKEDFKVLRNALESNHTGLYTYTDKPTMDSVFSQLEATFNMPITAIEFYRKITDLNQYIRNGHTQIIPPSEFEKKFH